MTRVLLLLTLLAVSGRGGGRATADEHVDPFDLVGSWRVAGTEQRVQFDPAGFEIADGCRTLYGTWRADTGGRFVAAVDGVLPCPDGSGAEVGEPGWPAEAGGVTVEGADRVLRSRDGAELVRLQPADAGPGAGLVDPDRAPSEQERRAVGPAAPMPPGLSPAGTADLTGRWTAVVSASAFVEFSADGSWRGSDGGTGAGGNWTSGADGAFLAAAHSVRTLMARDGAVDVAGQVAAARSAALDDGVLALLDVNGAELGRFDPA